VANLASAKKRARQTEKRTARNKARKSAVKTATRKLVDAVHDGKLDEAQKLLSAFTKTIDQVAAKGTVHKNTASRRKSRMAKRVNAAKVKAGAK
jgi:small subunit ribosomal protein S20